MSALHAQFSAPLKRFFRGHRLNSADVEDMTQEVFVRLANSDDRTPLAKPEAFVFTLARNLLRDRARRLHTRAVAKSVALTEVDLSCERPTPDRCLEFIQRLQQIEAALGRLKPPTREAFVRHRVDGDSYSDIASLMNISVSMVEKHIMSALLAVRSIEGP
ncbi:MAG TPA: RNA polymerase sigma factor [Steroidobacteraceae bacterium]|nr:RNA polymerase sigma factor [Steroidobacteraceae bacterium]